MSVFIGQTDRQTDRKRVGEQKSVKKTNDSNTLFLRFNRDY